jgi:hypothetical protein
MAGAELVSPDDIIALKKEANELTAIFTAIGKTAKENQKNKKIKQSEIEIPKSFEQRLTNILPKNRCCQRGGHGAEHGAAASVYTWGFAVGINYGRRNC